VAPPAALRSPGDRREVHSLLAALPERRRPQRARRCAAMSRLLALPSRPASLRLLVLAVSDRCDQRCAHCQIWMGPEAGRAPSLTLEQRLAVVEEALAMGIEE